FSSVSAVSDLPEWRKAAVILARVGDDLHIRIFDADGNRVVDKGEAKLTGGQEKTLLKGRFQADRVPNGKSLPPAESRKLLETAAAISGYTPARAREGLIETVKKGGKGKRPELAKGVPMAPHGAG